MLFQFEDRIPKIGHKTYVAHSAEVIGDVSIGDNCYIGPGAKIRGDYGSVRVGNKTSIQENCVIHSRAGEECIIGNNVIIGHGAILHGAKIQNNIMIGMGSIISDDATIKDWCIVGAAALVPPRQIIEEDSLIVGIPAKFKRNLLEKEKMMINISADVYAQLSERYLKYLKALPQE